MWLQLIAKPLQSKVKYTKHIRNKIKPHPLGCKNTRITLQQQRRINLKEALFYYGKCSVYPPFGGTPCSN